MTLQTCVLTVGRSPEPKIAEVSKKSKTLRPLTNQNQKILNISVIGAGQMGAGIAQVFAAAGHNVSLNDINQSAIDRGLAAIASSFYWLHPARRRGRES